MIREKIKTVTEEAKGRTMSGSSLICLASVRVTLPEAVVKVSTPSDVAVRLVDGNAVPTKVASVSSLPSGEK